MPQAAWHRDFGQGGGVAFFQALAANVGLGGKAGFMGDLCHTVTESDEINHLASLLVGSCVEACCLKRSPRDRNLAGLNRCHLKIGNEVNREIWPPCY